jgi:hypothetical protein
MEHGTTTATHGLAIALTEAEKALVQKIDFDPSGHNADSWRPSADAIEELMRSLLARHAIPEARLRFFDDADYRIGGHGRSRLQGFQKNGTDGADIVRHGNFVKYLRYFLYGPALPDSMIEALQRKVTACGKPFTGSDALEVADLARSLTRSHGLEPHRAAEEFYKLALDCRLDADDARTVRDRVKRAR